MIRSFASADTLAHSWEEGGREGGREEGGGAVRGVVRNRMSCSLFLGTQNVHLLYWTATYPERREGV